MTPNKKEKITKNEKPLSRVTPVQYSLRMQSRWVLADYGRKDLRKGKFWAWNETVNVWWRARMVSSWRWIRECDIIIRVFCARLREWDRKLIPEMRWCIAKWAIGDSERRRCRWSRKGDDRWGVSSTRVLNRDQVVQISRLSSGKSFVGNRKKFIFNAFVDFKPM